MNENLQIIYEFAPNIAWQVYPKDQFVYINNIKDNKFLYLDKTSKEIWMLIKEKKTVSEIISFIADKYKVEFTLIQDDVIEFINSIYKEGIIIKTA